MGENQIQGILWAAVTRDSTTLAEAGGDSHGGAVLSLAKKILAKKPSPGWEFEKGGGLRACKFHVHAPGKVWAVCCVYKHSNIPEIQVASDLSFLATARHGRWVRG